MKQRLRAFKNRVLTNIKRPEMRILPGQLAFFFILTLVPLTALAGLIPSFFGIDSLTVEPLLSENLPIEIANIFNSVVITKNIGLNTVIFLISSLLLASKGTKSIILASNQIYKIKNSSNLKMTIKSIFMLVVLIFLIVFIILVPTFGNYIVDFIIHLGIAEKSFFISIYKVLRIPLSFLIMFIAIKLLYTMAPDCKLPSKDTTYGALFTTLTWLIFTQGYSYYFKLFPITFSFYGNLSSVIILVWWLYFLAYFFVLGMALNVSKYEEVKRD